MPGRRGRLLARTDELLDMARDSLEIKRKVIQAHMDGGPVPLHPALPGHLAQPLLDLGVNGINEMIRNFSDDRQDITTPWGDAFALRCSTTSAPA
jgi:hypothetical protein